jgi:hypothetical protein
MNKTHLTNLVSAALMTIAVGLGVSILPSLTRAQNGIEGRTLEVSPPQQELTINPGATTSVKVKVLNPSKEDLKVAVRVEDFTAKGEEGQVALTQESGDYSVVKWVTFSPSSFTLKPGQNQDVTGTISVPAGAGGGRYGSFVFSVSGDTSATPGEQAVVAQEVASLFLVNVNGPKVEKLAMESFSAPKFQEFGPVPFTISYSNTGNVHLKPQGIIAVTDMFGKKATDLVVAGFNVFPGAKRTVTPTWDKKMIIGKFTANAIVYTGATNNDTLTATTTFIVFPIRIAAIILAVLIVLFLLRNRIGKAFRILASGK